MPNAPIFALASMLTLAAGCASSTGRPSAVGGPSALETRERVDPGPSFCESEIGGMNEEDVASAFNGMREEVAACAGSGVRGELGGTVTIALRLGRDGVTRWAYLKATTLGDREVEKCILEVARQRTWPRPVGGEGTAEGSFTIDARKAPAAWDERGVRATALAAQTATGRCRRGIDGSFVATAYVGRDGRVLSAGVAPPSPAGEGAADCVVDAVRRLRFRAAGPTLAKVSFAIR